MNFTQVLELLESNSNYASMSKSELEKALEYAENDVKNLLGRATDHSSRSKMASKGSHNKEKYAIAAREEKAKASEAKREVAAIKKALAKIKDK